MNRKFPNGQSGTPGKLGPRSTARRKPALEKRDGLCGHTLPCSKVFGVTVHRMSKAEVVDLILAKAKAGGAPSIVVTPNLQHVYLLRTDQELQEVYDSAEFVVADGVPLVWASRLFGPPLPERVNGTDLMLDLCARPASREIRIGLFGGNPGSARRCGEALKKRNSGLNICCRLCPSRGFENDPEQSAAIEKELRSAAPDLLFVALGSPKQEIWMHRRGRALGIPVSLGIGGSFELIAGDTPRAPVCMRRSGLEWLFRLWVEPRRLWRRYALCLGLFPWLLLKETWNRMKARLAG